MGRRWHTRKTALRVTANCHERAGMWALANSWVRVRVRVRVRGRVRGRVRVTDGYRVRRRVSPLAAWWITSACLGLGLRVRVRVRVRVRASVTVRVTVLMDHERLLVRLALQLQ